MRSCCAREVRILLGVHQSSLSFRSFFLFELLRSLRGASFQKCGLHPVTSLFSRFKVSFTKNLFSGTRNPSTFKFLFLKEASRTLRIQVGWSSISSPRSWNLWPLGGVLRILQLKDPAVFSSRGGMPHRKDPNPRKTEGQST